MCISYGLGFFLYSFVGLVGSLAIFGNDTVIKPNTIMDYFPKEDISVFIVSLLFAILLLCIMPFLVMISRNQFLGLFYDSTD